MNAPANDVAVIIQAEQALAAAHFLSIWVREEGQWRNVAYMATDLA